ncbi:hypothetical protein ABTL95_20345, partial [Acinetobacter baumannii]
RFHDRWQASFEAMSTDRKFSRDDRTFVVRLRIESMSDAANHDLCGLRGHLTRGGKTGAETLDEEPTVWVQHDLDD